MTTVTKRTPSGVAGGATQRIAGAITVDATKRVVGAITASTTVRVPETIIEIGPYLLLEGDSSGTLSFTATDEVVGLFGYLKLQGTYV